MQRMLRSQRWAWILLAGYGAVTVLSWVSMAPGPDRTLLRALVVAGISAVATGWILVLNRDEGTQGSLRRVRWVAVCVGLCGILATPMLTRDVWCYAGFARATAGGLNPYVTPLPEAIQSEFSVPSCGGTMPYGPVWTYAMAAVDRAVAPMGLTAEVLAIRGVLTAAWIGMASGVAWLQRTRDLRTRAVGLAAMTVLPASAFELLAESHNDVVVMALVVWWLVLREKGSWLAPLPLAASILVKYFTAPLLVVAAVDAWRRGAYREAGVALTAGVAILATGFAWWQDGALVAALTANNAHWRWLSAPFAIELIVKNVASMDWVETWVWLWRGLVGLGVAWFVRDWWRQPSRSDRPLYAVLGAGMLGLLASAEYLWPWYLAWALPFVVLAEDRRLWSVAGPLFTVLPVAHVAWAGGQPAYGNRTAILMVLLLIIPAASVVQWWSSRRS